MQSCSKHSDAPGVQAMDLAPYLDHTLLRPDATRAALSQHCEEAQQYGFATVCVNSGNVAYCSKRLSNCATRPSAVVGFPLGACATAAKAYEARHAADQGAVEIDMVGNLGALVGGDFVAFGADIEAVVGAVGNIAVKVILETALLAHHNKVIGCTVAQRAGAAFVKTSTGFGPGGATAADVMLLRAVVGPSMGVKASGGIRTATTARAMLAAGASRIGTTASVAIVAGGGAPEQAY